jgi:multimeric flavodoxin WrbA
MKITILNGDLQPTTNAFSRQIEEYVEQLRKSNQVDLFTLTQMDLHYCTGCWSCWWKTPGECTTKDDAEIIFRSVIHSDLVIFASPLIAGFPSSALKKIMDRLIVLLHPYIEIVKGECHHRKRYEKYPNIAVILDRETDTDDEDIKIVKDIFDRLAINFHSKLVFVKMIDEVTKLDFVIMEEISNDEKI